MIDQPASTWGAPRAASRRSPVLAAVLALSLAACVEPAAEVAETPAEPVTSERAAPFGDGSLRYLDRSAGAARDRALVLVHGWASDSRVWRGELELAPPDWRVIALDLPGHGGSTGPGEGEVYSMDLFADGIAAVLDDAGVEQAVLVGHSNGTPTVRQFYRRYPERTLALVAVDGPLRQMFSAEEAEPFFAAFRGETWQEAVGGYVESMPAPNLAPEARAEILEMALGQSQEVVVGGFDAAVDPGVWTDDPISVPLLVVLAEQPIWTPEYEAAVRELAPEVDYRVWGDGTGHFLMLERPEELHRALAEFVEAHDLL